MYELLNGISNVVADASRIFVVLIALFILIFAFYAFRLSRKAKKR